MTSYDDDDARWGAVTSRDRGADGVFWYGVRTTGVYCRPSCGSRQPRRENVVFFDDRSAAETQGFRACKRCRPNEDTAPGAQIIAECARRIEAAIAQGEPAPSLAALAAAVGRGKHHLHRSFVAAMGVTPGAYAAKLRADRAQAALVDGAAVTEAIFDAGYGASSRFYEKSEAFLGMTPRRWRDGGAGETIRFAVAETSLGPLLVAATARGLCAVRFGDDADALLRGLQDHFPKAQLIGGDAAFERVVAQVVGLVERPRATAPALPADLQGTAFQHRVWSALRAIPMGRTATYTDIATLIGSPTAVRAVAKACASNPAALVVPCHRVIRQDGALAGYAWGVDRKAALLRRETDEALA